MAPNLGNGAAQKGNRTLTPVVPAIPLSLLKPQHRRSATMTRQPEPTIEKVLTPKTKTTEESPVESHVTEGNRDQAIATEAVVSKDLGNEGFHTNGSPQGMATAYAHKQP